MGLGIVRNEGYENYLEEGYLKYQPGDVMVMYTDGIVEAKNQENQEFGYEKLRLLLDHYKALSAKEIKSKIVDAVYDFVGREILPDDDYSILVIKFNA